MRSSSPMRAGGFVTLFVVALLALLAGCTSDPPTKPEQLHSNIYATVSNWWGGDTTSVLLIYDADSLMHIDSIPLPNIAEWGEASPDGRYLYLVMWRNRARGEPYDYLLALDLQTGTPIWTHDGVDYDWFSGLKLLDNGRLLIFGNEVIDATTGATLRMKEEAEFNLWDWYFGPLRGSEVAAVANDTLVVATDVRTGERRGGFVPRVTPGERPFRIDYSRLHPDGNRALCVGPRSALTDSWFVVGDLSTGRQRLAARLTTPYVDIAISEDGTLAAVVDGAYDIGWPAVYVFDLIDYQLLAKFDSDNQLRYWPGQVRFLPGGRRIVISPDNSIAGVGWLQTFDLNTMTSEFVVDTPFFDPFMGALAVGPRLEP